MENQKKSDRETIIDFYNKANGKQKEDIAAFYENVRLHDLNKRGDDVESIEFNFLSNTELITGAEFEIGAIVTLNDGIVLKTKNLGGEISPNDIRLLVTGVTEIDDNTFRVGFCDQLKDEKIGIELSGYEYRSEAQYFDVVSCTRDPKIVEQEILAARQKKEDEERKKQQAIDRAAAEKRAQENTKRDANNQVPESIYTQNSEKYKSPFKTNTDFQLSYFNVESEHSLIDGETLPLAVRKIGNEYVVLHAYAETWSEKSRSKIAYPDAFGFVLAKHNSKGEFIRFGQAKSFKTNKCTAGSIKFEKNKLWLHGSIF